MKRAILSVCLLGVLSGCSRDQEVRDFVTAVDQTTQEMEKALDAKPDIAQGIQAAQAVFQAKREALKAQYASLQDVRGFQVKEETLQALERAVVDSTTRVVGLRLKVMDKTLSHPELDAKLKQLGDDYADLFQDS